MASGVQKFIVLLDSGNSRLKCRAISDGFPSTKLAEVAIDNSSPSFFEALLRDWQELFGCLQAVYGVSVVSSTLQMTWQGFLHNVFPLIDIQWLKVEAESLGLQNHYDIQQLGKDRWFGVLGSYHHQKEHHSSKAFLYISFGTATTIDAIIDDGYVGGVILPGVRMMQRSLFQGTAQLPEVLLVDKVHETFPTSTQEAIESGIIIAQVGAVLQQWHSLKQGTDTPPILYITGGAKSVILPALKRALQERETIPPTIIELDTPVLDGIEAYISNKRSCL